MDNKETVCTDSNRYEVHDLQLEILNSERNHLEQNLQQSQDNMGQIESKKLSKKLQNTQMQTKGTSMSFGFRKNFNSTPKKLKNLIKNNTKCNSKQLKTKLPNDNRNTAAETNDNHQQNTAEVVQNEKTKFDEDSNGNPESLKDETLAKTTATETNTKPMLAAAEQLGNRTAPVEGKICFGNFTLARSLSTDLPSRLQKNKQKKSNIKNNNANETGNNNNNGSNTSSSSSTSSRNNNRVTFASNLKYRSKSAHTGKIGSNSSRETKVAGNPSKFIAFNSKAGDSGLTLQKFGQRLQTAPSVLATKRTTNPSTAYSKFTLHTMNLPKAEYAVPISISTPTPTYKANALPTFVEKVGAGVKSAPTIQRNVHLPMPSAVFQQHRIDAKTAKQIANNSTRRMFCDSREISADSGIASLDVGLEESNKRRSSRLNQLNMVQKLAEVYSFDDSQSSECSIVEPLALPKLPSDNQIIPLPLNGLTRSNTASSQEMHEVRTKKQQQQQQQEQQDQQVQDVLTSSTYKQRSTTAVLTVEDEHTKIKDDMIVELKSELPATIENELKVRADETGAIDYREKEESTAETLLNDLNNSTNLSKFAKMALEGSEFLLDDEPSPTDSLVSNSEFEFDICKQRKQKLNKEYQEKDDELVMELDDSSPLSPLTPPLNASPSFSLSDCGNLIDDEIADQPALLCNQKAENDGVEGMLLCKETCNTPTQIASMDCLPNYMVVGELQGSQHASASDNADFNLLTPLSLRKSLIQGSNSLGSTSPCESICSDDLIMDFDMVSSMDSIDIKSRCVTDLKTLSENKIFRELQPNYFDMNFLTSNKTNTKDKTNNYTIQLPKHAIRLLNRSRLQQQQQQLQQQYQEEEEGLKGQQQQPTSVFKATKVNSKTSEGIPSPASSQNNSGCSSLKRQTKPINHFYYQQQQNQHQQHQQNQQQRRLNHREIRSCSDDLMLYDKSFRNAMIQDVLQFKRQLIHLRHILQEFDILNPFDNDNGQRYGGSCGFDSNVWNGVGVDIEALTSTNTDYQMQQLADIQRQIVYLQGQVDDRDRTIRLQKDVIKQLESDKDRKPELRLTDTRKECVNTATQTERMHPISIGMENLNRNKPQCSPYISLRPTYEDTTTSTTTIIQHHRQNSSTSKQQQEEQQQQPSTANNRCQMHRTIISTSFKNYNQQLLHRSWMPQTHKSVKITLIGDPAAAAAVASAYSNKNSTCTNITKQMP